MKKRIIISGYPKSGNTWLTRLTAEIVGCPVSGFWLAPHTKESAVEGENRVLEYVCFKNHYSFMEWEKASKNYTNGTESFIYIIRDPRDVVLSGANFFNFPPAFPKFKLLLSSFNRGLTLYTKLFDRNEEQRKKEMTTILLKGWYNFSPLKTPWKEHVRSYEKSNALYIKYEDLLEDGIKQAKRICKHFNINKSEAALSDILYNQSFDIKKSKLLEMNRTQGTRLFRKGIAGGWKKELGKKNVDRLNYELSDILSQYGYSK